MTATTKPAKMTTIVLAWTEGRLVYDGTPYKADLGAPPPMREEIFAHSAIWLNSGDESDLAKARSFAEAEGYKVFSYPTGESDPHGRARADVLSSARR